MSCIKNLKYVLIAGVFCHIQLLLHAMDEQPNPGMTPPRITYLLPPAPRHMDSDDEVIDESEFKKIQRHKHKMQLRNHRRIMKLCLNENSDRWSLCNRTEARMFISAHLFEPNFTDNGYSLLIAACSNADTLLVRTLLENDADPNIHINNKSPLEAVIESKTSLLQSQINCINYLIEYDAYPLHITKLGLTYLHIAAGNNPALLIPLLQTKSLGALINTTTFKNKETPLTTLIQHGWNKSPNNKCLKKALTALLERNADPAIEDSSGHSSYYHAQQHINQKILSWLNEYNCKELSKNH